jgi:AraC-like DNA-binding protein
MDYSTFVPDLKLQSVVECYWIVEGKETEWQKITPDGYTELIFHFGDRYEVRHSGKDSELQPHTIAAGQIDTPLFLRPTGKSGVLGIKFQPTGIWKLFGFEMSALTNRTVDLSELLGDSAKSVHALLCKSAANEQRITIVEEFLVNRQQQELRKSEIDEAVKTILSGKGQATIQQLSEKSGLSPRKMERLFKQQVGVSAKLYSRIIRFAQVYKLLRQPELSKAEATYLSGYFDQAHFNKEFREFAGENPESYFKQNHSFSDFFLNR